LYISLHVLVEQWDLSVIHWANSGWLDSTHFTPENISSGEVQFTSDRGYRYTVTLGDFGGGCYSGSTRLQNDVNDDIEQEETIKAEETCPECGFSKFSTEDLCSSCKRKVTCPECGGRKDKYEDLCYSCEANKEEDKE
jgi:rubredoxin